MKREDAVPRYFTKTPKKPTPEPPDQTAFGCFVMGLLFALIGVAALILLFTRADFLRFAGFPFLLVGLILAVLGFFFRNSIERDNQAKLDVEMEKYNAALAKAEPKPDPEQLDEWLQADMDRYNVSADMFHGISPQMLDDRKIIVKGIFEGVEAIIGKDNRIRFSAYELLFIYFHERSLSLVKTTHYLRTGKPDKVLVDEIHAGHIDSVSFETRNGFPIKLNHQERKVDGIHRLKIWLTGSRTIEVDTLDGVLYVAGDNVVVNPPSPPDSNIAEEETMTELKIGNTIVSLENVDLKGDLAQSNGIEAFYDLKEFVDNWRG